MKSDRLTVVIDPASDLARILADADESVVLENDSVRYRVEREADALFANYDPERIRAVLRQSAGALAGVDATVLKRELRAQRTQSANRHSARLCPPIAPSGSA